MANAILYYRTLNTLSNTTNATTPSALNTNFASQCLEFTFSDNLLEGLSFDYQNNILDIPVPNSSGTRKINKQENGLKSITITINGRFKKPSSGLDSDIAILRTMATRSNLDTSHPFGNVGLYSPNAPEFSLDPNAISSNAGSPQSGTVTPATKGLTLDSFSIGYNTPQVKEYGFRATLKFGGTWTG